MGMILRIASSRIVGQGDIVGRSGYFSLNLSANSVMRGRLDARRTLKSLVADLRFITHDLNEAIKLGDRIAIMKDGEIVQTGTSEEILTEPANAYVERFVENVDRSKIITASSIMADKPLVARLKKEGPEVLIRKMRERNLTVLPVVDAGNILVGEVRLNDLLKLRKEQIRSIDTVVHHEVHSVLSDTILEDILPLMTRTNSPIWVVNENREFQGVVPLSSLIIEVTGKNKEEINEIIQNAIEL